MTEDPEVDIEAMVKGEIDLPKLDVTPYIGKEVPIDLITTHKGQHGYYVKVQTAILDTIERPKGNIELRASRILGLHEDANGDLGWGKDTKTANFLKDHGVGHYKELKGKKVIVQKRDNSDFLTFV